MAGPTPTFKDQGIDSYPLCWPVGWKRTNDRERSRFKTTFGRARDEIFAELKRMGVGDWNVVLSTNIPLRRDGLPYSGMAQPKDPGVAVYFRHRGKPMVFACDNYHKIEDNMHAIVKTIEAIRGIERWGASEMMERTFTGFQALPAPKQKKPWWEVLGVKQFDHPNRIKEMYHTLARANHPDQGGDPAKMAEINDAYRESMG